ncbi:c-type cytochrome [Roseibium algae]|uniref:Cytochrome c n=1 Tax=Roseibium algae TaxID=3123038 RepID=A0ABU8TM05_9HYPH
MKSKIPAGIAALMLLTGLLWRFIEAQPETTEDFGTPLVKVEVPKLQGEAKAGKGLFNGNCASCHGANAAGREGVAPPLVHRIYEPSHHSDGAFVIAALQGVRAHHWPFGDMPKVEGVTQEDVVKIIAYVRALQKANGIF